ncbi:uncharacterized protein LOC107265434 [Cephus cinctus]|uniref:Uncharacterized protein LOC107265434 n=1 Tax=Cephus cinctus TaxID=211228 RepID=A0AAJ7BNB2_CEPCN|nr:uncharacterized protein LOC107265434 [Cephus cinctus]
MRLLVLFFLVGASLAAPQYNNQYSTTTPVPILKQINRHNEDGSYSYGYEAADGSYKIESKYPTGEVYGKYGFVDDTGSVREVEYGASRRGFEPAGSGINVPPPTVNGNSIAGPNDPQDDGQYREDPSIYYTDPKYTNGEHYKPAPKQRYQQPAYSPPQQRYQQPAAPPAPAYNPVPARYNPPATYNQPAPVEPEYQQQYQPEYQPEYQQQYQQPQYQPSQYSAPAPIPQSRFQGHPASNIDINSGSYSVNYKR